MLVNKSPRRRREDGFTLLELLITILIVTVGLLGLAKMEAAAVSNTALARTRALMTYQAESLAGMMRANRTFWVTTSTSASYPQFAVSTTGVVTNTGMTSWPTCLNVALTSPCTPQQLAYDDMVNNWAPNFINAFPNASVLIACVPPPPGTTCVANPPVPNGYDITLTWQQKLVAVNTSTAGTSQAAMLTPVSMVMHVQPGVEP